MTSLILPKIKKMTFYQIAGGKMYLSLSFSFEGLCGR